MNNNLLLIVLMTIMFATGLYFFVEVMVVEEWTRQTWRECIVMLSCFGAFGYTVSELPKPMDQKEFRLFLFFA